MTGRMAACWLAAFSITIAGEGIAAEVAAPKEDVAARAQMALDATRGMTARFTQKVESKGFGDIRSASGQVAISKPGRMRWEYDEPSPILIVADGEKLWYFDKESNTVFIELLGGQPSARSPAMFLAGDAPLDEIFHISLSKADVGAEMVGLKLIPRQPWPGFKGALLKVDAKSFIINELLIVDHLGNRNTISFTDIDTKASPAPSMFQFTPPAGANVRQTVRLPAPQAPGL